MAKLFGSSVKFRVFREKIVLRTAKKLMKQNMLVLAKKRLVLHVYVKSYVLKLRSALVKFSTRATKKSLAGYMRPAGLNLATSGIEEPLSNDHLSTTGTILGPENGGCTQV